MHSSMHVFEPVREAFEALSKMTTGMSAQAWSQALEYRLAAMERAMAILDARGLFGRAAARDNILISAEIVPPASCNAAIIKRLNPSKAAECWALEVGGGGGAPL